MRQRRANGVLAKHRRRGDLESLGNRSDRVRGQTHLALAVVRPDSLCGDGSGLRPSTPRTGTLALNAAHPFTVTLSATDPHTGEAAPGVATQVNDLWGYSSIPAITGNPENPEVFVKLLDGTAINGEYCFLSGGLTNLEYTLTVTDATTGIEDLYEAGRQRVWRLGHCGIRAMRRRNMFAVVVAFLVSAALRAGVGVWTATPNTNAGTVVVAPDGTVYTDWGTLQIARSKDHGVSWQPFPGRDRWSRASIRRAFSRSTSRATST